MKKSEIFQDKVRQKPDNIMFRFSLAQALYDEEASADAIEHLECCVRSREDWMLPRILLGKALLEAGRPEVAKPYLEAALELAIAQHHEDPATELRHILSDLQ